MTCIVTSEWQEAPLTGDQEACTSVPPPGVTADLTGAEGQAQEVDAEMTYRPRSGFPGHPGMDVVCVCTAGLGAVRQRCTQLWPSPQPTLTPDP